jgi:hypothetical protein
MILQDQATLDEVLRLLWRAQLDLSAYSSHDGKGNDCPRHALGQIDAAVAKIKTLVK